MTSSSKVIIYNELNDILQTVKEVVFIRFSFLQIIYKIRYLFTHFHFPIIIKGSLIISINHVKRTSES